LNGNEDSGEFSRRYEDEDEATSNRGLTYRKCLSELSMAVSIG